MDDGKPKPTQIVRVVSYCIAEVAELVDALASGASDRKVVGVRVPFSAKLIITIKQWTRSFRARAF